MENFVGATYTPVQRTHEYGKLCRGLSDLHSGSYTPVQRTHEYGKLCRGDLHSGTAHTWVWKTLWERPTLRFFVYRHTWAHTATYTPVQRTHEYGKLCGSDIHSGTAHTWVWKTLWERPTLRYSAHMSMENFVGWKTLWPTLRYSAHMSDIHSGTAHTWVWKTLWERQLHSGSAHTWVWKTLWERHTLRYNAHMSMENFGSDLVQRTHEFVGATYTPVQRTHEYGKLCGSDIHSGTAHTWVWKTLWERPTLRYSAHMSMENFVGATYTPVQRTHEYGKLCGSDLHSGTAHTWVWETLWERPTLRYSAHMSMENFVGATYTPVQRTHEYGKLCGSDHSGTAHTWVWKTLWERPTLRYSAHMSMENFVGATYTPVQRTHEYGKLCESDLHSGTAHTWVWKTLWERPTLRYSAHMSMENFVGATYTPVQRTHEYGKLCGSDIHSGTAHTWVWKTLWERHTLRYSAHMSMENFVGATYTPVQRTHEYGKLCGSDIHSGTAHTWVWKTLWERHTLRYSAHMSMENFVGATYTPVQRTHEYGKLCGSDLHSGTAHTWVWKTLWERHTLRYSAHMSMENFVGATYTPVQRTHEYGKLCGSDIHSGTAHTWVWKTLWERPTLRFSAHMSMENFVGATYTPVQRTHEYGKLCGSDLHSGSAHTWVWKTLWERHTLRYSAHMSMENFVGATYTPVQRTHEYGKLCGSDIHSGTAHTWVWKTLWERHTLRFSAHMSMENFVGATYTPVQRTHEYGKLCGSDIHSGTAHTWVWKTLWERHTLRYSAHMSMENFVGATYTPVQRTHEYGKLCGSDIHSGTAHTWVWKTLWERHTLRYSAHMSMENFVGATYTPVQRTHEYGKLCGSDLHSGSAHTWVWKTLWERHTLRYSAHMIMENFVGATYTPVQRTHEYGKLCGSDIHSGSAHTWVWKTLWERHTLRYSAHMSMENFVGATYTPVQRTHEYGKLCGSDIHSGTAHTWVWKTLWERHTLRYSAHMSMENFVGATYTPVQRTHEYGKLCGSDIHSGTAHTWVWKTLWERHTLRYSAHMSMENFVGATYTPVQRTHEYGKLCGSDIHSGTAHTWVWKTLWERPTLRYSAHMSMENFVGATYTPVQRTHECMSMSVYFQRLTCFVKYQK